MILDIHSHHLNPEAIYDASPRLGKSAEEIPADQLFSAGIHPWDTTSPIAEEMWQKLEKLLDDPRCAAVGEAGIDLSGKGGMMFQQLLVFKRLIEYSERLKRPLIVHCVKAEDIILGLIRDLRPTQPWIIHGYRKKPQSAQQLLSAGCFLSFGPMFNADTVREAPSERLLAETDDSDADIHQVLASLSEARGEDVTPLVAHNIGQIIGIEQ